MQSQTDLICHDKMFYTLSIILGRRASFEHKLSPAGSVGKQVDESFETKEPERE